MSAVTHLEQLDALNAEWGRIDLLAQCLSEMRQGRDLSEELLARLKESQQAVEAARSMGLWQRVVNASLGRLECDLLACVLAPVAEPRLGYLYQGLQIGAAQPYATPALIQELLALDVGGSALLYQALSGDAPLRREQWLQLESLDPFQPIRPSDALIARVLRRPAGDAKIPGARPVVGEVPWDSLILPPDRLAMLREFMWWIQHRRTVFEEWGARPSGGPVALFAGPSGTGKTYAAQVIASALGWPLYRVDLGQLVSKYIGETEKNLNRLFDTAHGRSVILQFDEADALFGKRGEVKEARDRYANMEVSHLLARIEAHEGPCILTTNLRRNLDAAFARRFQLVMDFPRPDALARARLWQHLMPPAAPRARAVDPVFLGASVNLTGGGIRNAALHAAVLAAGTEEPRGLHHIALAVWRELGKDGRDLSISDLGALAPYLPEQGLC